MMGPRTERENIDGMVENIIRMADMLQDLKGRRGFQLKAYE